MERRGVHMGRECSYRRARGSISAVAGGNRPASEPKAKTRVPAAYGLARKQLGNTSPRRRIRVFAFGSDAGLWGTQIPPNIWYTAMMLNRSIKDRVMEKVRDTMGPELKTLGFRRTGRIF